MAVKPPTKSVVLGKNYDTNQIYSAGVEFALVGRVDKKWKQATTFVFCKDFLHDAVWSAVNKTPIEIYDFRYNPTKKAIDDTVEPSPKYSNAWYDWEDRQYLGRSGGKPKIDIPIHMGRTSLLLRDGEMKSATSKKLFHEHREGCVDFLRQVDKQMGFRPSEIYQVKGTKSSAASWLILGDKRWMLAPTLVSLFALLIRVGYYHNAGGSYLRTLEMMRNGELGFIGGDDYGYSEESSSANDSSYVTQAWKAIEVILKHGVKVFHPTMAENYPNDESTHTFHDNYGIVNFALKRPAKRHPSWYRKSLWK